MRRKKGMGTKVTGMRPSRMMADQMKSVRPDTVPQRGVPTPKRRSGLKRITRHGRPTRRGT
jgi:hypothetical protein